MLAKKRPYSCLVYPKPHASLFPTLQPEQRDFLNHWRHLLNQQPDTNSGADTPVPVPTTTASDVDQSVAAVVASAESMSASASWTTETSDHTPSPARMIPSTSASAAQPKQAVTDCAVASVADVSGLWSSLVAEVSLPVVEVVTSFCSQLRALLLHMHASHTTDECHCLTSLLGELGRTVLRTRAQLRPKRNQPLPPRDTSTPSPPPDHHIQSQILLRLALPDLSLPQSDEAVSEGVVGGSVGFECDSEQLVELFELLQSVTSERDTVTFFRSVVVPQFATTQQAEAIRRVCGEMGWALPLELRDVRKASEEEERWVESEEEDLDDMLQLQPVRLTRTEILASAAPLPVPQEVPPSRTISSASSTTARTNSLPLSTAIEPVRRSSLPVAPSALPLLGPSLYPPSTSASAALSQLRQQRMREQLRHQENYEKKLKRAREGITEEEERARHQQRQRDDLQALTKLERFVSNKVRIITRLPSTVAVRTDGGDSKQSTQPDTTATKRKGVRQLLFHGQCESSASADTSSTRSSSVSSTSSATTCSGHSVSPVVAVSGVVEFVAETPMTRGMGGRAGGSSERALGSHRSQRARGSRSRRSLTSLLEQQAVS